MPRDDVGEPISSGRRDLRVVDRRAVGDVIAFLVLAFVVLVNGILAILLIETFIGIGWWTREAVDEVAIDLAGRTRLRLGQAV
jgi:hypothetical protein